MSASVSPAAVVEVDERLLDVLPDAVDGVPVQFSPEASADVAGGAVEADVEALAYAVGGGPGNLLVASVVRPKRDAFDDGWFRLWRDTYNEGVCERAGGVRGGVAEARIDERNVFIGSCVDGGHTYFAWLERRGLIVSVYAIGDRRLGERLMGALEE